MKPFVRVVGVSLAAGCAPGQVTDPIGPPGAPMAAPGPVMANPPPPPPPVSPVLPTWDSVQSGHPPGATNPPFPVLVVTRDTGACYKEWFGGMIPPPPRQRAAGGLVLETTAEVAEYNGTQVQCPPGQPAALLERWDHPDAPVKP